MTPSDSARVAQCTLAYLANARLPTEKAHGLQIVQNCEALTAAGVDVTLFAARRVNTRALAGVDIWTHYDVSRTFAHRRVACLDLFPLGRRTEWLAAPVQAVSYTLALLVALRRRRPDVCYSRDIIPLVALSLCMPRRAFVYEAHQRSRSTLGRWLQRACVRRARTVIAVTDHLAAELRRLGARHVIVLRDGFRADRFAHPPDRDEARRRIAVPPEAFVVGYVGRVQTMGMSKGLDVLIEAVAMLADPRIHLVIVGGPAEHVGALRSRWLDRGLAPAAFHAPGDVRPADVPAYLAAFDVCAMPFPWTEHFAYDASPLKLFEYMAAGRAIVASALPAIAEVVRDNETALLVPPDDTAALRAALARLRDDAALRDRLGAAARVAAQAFTWQARAERIVRALGAQAVNAAP